MSAYSGVFNTWLACPGIIAFLGVLNHVMLIMLNIMLAMLTIMLILLITGPVLCLLCLLLSLFLVE